MSAIVFVLLLIAGFYAFCAVVSVWDSYDQHRRGFRTLSRVRHNERAVRALRNRPQPQPVPGGIELSWVTHDEVLDFLSPSVRADFQSAAPKRGRKPLSNKYHPYSRTAEAVRTERSLEGLRPSSSK